MTYRTAGPPPFRQRWPPPETADPETCLGTNIPSCSIGHAPAERSKRGPTALLPRAGSWSGEHGVGIGKRAFREQARRPEALIPGVVLNHAPIS